MLSAIEGQNGNKLQRGAGWSRRKPARRAGAATARCGP